MVLEQKPLTGKPSIDRPWMKYYPPGIEQMEVPECTLLEYLKHNCPGENEIAMHYYGKDITWATVYMRIDIVAQSLKEMGFGEGDQIPVFLRAVPEFVYLLLAAERIGASLLCRDNTIEENVEAVRKSGAKVIFAHDFLSQEDMNAYLSGTYVEKIVTVVPTASGRYTEMPDYVQKCLMSNYPKETAHGPAIMRWSEFVGVGLNYRGVIDAPVDINRPLFRAYTSGSTGASKQVIHSAHTIIGVLAQMNFYGGMGDQRPTWLTTILPPALVAVVISMVMLPLASNKLLILDPFCDVEDVDLELMRYKPNSWPMIPMFIEQIMRNGRIPADYDMSHLHAAGAGCEAYNNNQLSRAQRFLHNHNCDIRFTTGYGSSEAGSNLMFHMEPQAIKDGNIGVPMPLTTVSIFKQGTDEELTYNQIGEICKCGPGTMLGYDDPIATEKALKLHSDGKVWLHMGDTGYMTEDGVVYLTGRAKSPRYTGGYLDLLPMENRLADADIKGIDDEFFVIVPDPEHPGFFLPHLYVVLEDGYTIDDIADKVHDCLEPHMYPAAIHQVPERPFFHFKTNRIGLKRELQMMGHTI